MASAADASAPAAPISASGLMPLYNSSEWWLNVEQARATGVTIPDWMLGDTASTGGVVLVRQLCDAVVELQDECCKNVDNATAFLLSSAKVPVSGHRRYSPSTQAHAVLVHFLARRLAQDPQRVSAITATYSKLLSALATQQQQQQPYLLPTIPAANLTAAEAAAQVRQHVDAGALFVVLDHSSRDVSSFISALDAARLPALEFQRVGWGNAEGMSGTKPPSADIKYGSMARLAASCDAALLLLARQMHWGALPAPTTSRQHWCAFASALLCHLPDVHPDHYQAGAELEGEESGEEGAGSSKQQAQQEEGSEGPPSKRAKVSNGSSKGRKQKKAAPQQEQEQQQAQAQEQEQQQDALNNEPKPSQQEQQQPEQQQQQQKSVQEAVREAQLQVLQAQAEEMAQYRALHPKELWSKEDRVWEAGQSRGGTGYPPPLGFLGVSRTKRVAFLRTAYGHDTHITRNPGVATGLPQVLQHLGLYLPNGEGSKDGKYTWLVPPGHSRQGQAAAEGLLCFDATQVKSKDGKADIVTELHLPRAGSLLQRAQEQRWPCDSTLLLLSDDATGAAVRANCGGGATAAAAGHAAAGTAPPQAPAAAGTAAAAAPAAEDAAGTSSAAVAAHATTTAAPAADPAKADATTSAAAPPAPSSAPPAGRWPHATLQVFSTLSELCQIYSYAFTTTSLHTEDLALGAMNTLVAGAPKMWLVAPTRQVAEAFYARVGSARRPAFFSKLLHLRTPGLGVDDLLDLGMVPLVQQPGMTVVSATSMDAIHVTVSSGFSLAQSANCHYSGRASLGQHVEEVVARGEPPANKAVLAHYRAVAAAGGSYSMDAVLRRPGKK